MDLTKKKPRVLDIKKSRGYFRYGAIAFLSLVGILKLVSHATEEAIFFFFLSILASSFYDGVQVDLTRGRIKVYTSFFFFKTGTWMPLANFKYIVVSEVAHTARRSGNTTWNTMVFLSPFNIYKQQSIILFEDSSHRQAVLKAKEIGKQIGFEVKINE